MIIANRILNMEYDIDCENFGIKNIGQLKSYLINYLEGVRYDNIKLFDNTGSLGNYTPITDDMVYIGLAIVPIVCTEHRAVT